MYYLCEKYYKPITVQYYIADCVSWVSRLTLLDLLTNKLDLTNAISEWNSFICRGLNCIGILSEFYFLIIFHVPRENLNG